MMQLLSKLKSYLSSPAFNNLRAVLYVALPAALWQLAKTGQLSTDHATLLAAVAVAAASPALASVFAPSGLKTYIAGLLVPVQAALVGIGGASNTWAMLAAAVIGSIVSSGLWAANVHNATPSESDTTASKCPGSS